MGQDDNLGEAGQTADLGNWQAVEGVPEFDRSQLPQIFFENKKSRQSRFNWMDQGVLLPVIDQRPHETCVATSLCHSLQVRRRIAGQPVPALDAEMFHGCVLGLPFARGNTDIFRTLVKLRDVGAPIANSGFSPGLRCTDFAPGFVRSSGHSQMSTASLAKDVVSTYAPVVVIMTAEQKLAQVDDFSIYRDTGGAKTFRHAMLLIGFDDDSQCWIVQNSYGKGWGEDGFGRIAYDSASILSDNLHRCFIAE